MFAQIIECPIRDADGMRRHFFAGVERLHPTAVGWLGATSGVTADGVWINVIRFESPEAAELNAARPEQGQWWNEGEQYRDGHARFVDSTDVTALGDGRAHAARFVRTIEGAVEDRAPIERLLANASAARHRPEGWAIWHDDAVTLVAVYPSRSDADADSLLDDFTASLSHPRVHDIGDPWLA